MSSTSNITEWENLVKNQLKTEDIYSVLSKENLEGIHVKPYYSGSATPLHTLPKVAESTHLVAEFSENSDENVYAFLAEKSVENFDGKSIFVPQNFVENEFKFSPGNVYFSLVDCFNDLGEEEGNYEYILDENLAKRLLQMPFNRAICVDISVHQNSGAAIYQQLWIALAKCKELTEKFGADVLKTIIFKTAIGGNYFFEIAKIRALKILFNQFSKEFGMDEVPFIYAETSLRNKAKNDPENNLIRSALELSAAMIGGADAVFSNDFKLGNSTELSREISFKQQILLAYESIINVFDDAGSGSFYIEDITQQLCKKAWNFFIEIEESGGYLKLLNEGIIQKKIFEQAVSEQNWVEEGKIKLIGVNLYPKLEKTKKAGELYSENQIKPVRWSEMYE